MAVTQLEMNQIMSDLGVERYNQRVSEAIRRGKESQSIPGQRLMGDAVERVEKALVLWVQENSTRPGRRSMACMALKTCKLDIAAGLAVQAVIDSLSMSQSYLSTCTRIANYLEDEERCRKFASDMRSVWKEARFRSKTMAPYKRRRYIRRQMVKTGWEGYFQWEKRLKYQIGGVLLDLVEKHTKLVEVKTVRKPASKGGYGRRIVAATDETLQWVSECHDYHRSRHPFLLPMVDPPVPFTSEGSGGYPANVLIHKRSMIMHRITELLPQPYEKMPEVYDAINSIQATSWRINQTVWEVFQYFWENQIEQVDLPGHEILEMPPKPEGVNEDKELRKMWYTSRAMARNTNRTNMSKKILFSRIYHAARLFPGQEIYFPHSLDFRGRVYPIPTFLNPQGCCLAKGLLEFSEEKPLGPRGHVYLAIHGANCWGEDKVSFDDRIQWVEDNEDMILECSSDPLGALTWTRADKPWQFLAFCEAWAGYKELGSAYKCSLPIAMDGSNNGLQLFSLLLRDPVGAAATNVSPAAVPRDIYQEVGDKVYGQLLEDLNDPELAELARVWLSFLKDSVPRSMTKRPVMTYPYGATLHSCMEYVSEWFLLEVERRCERPHPKTHKICAYLAKLTRTAIEDTVQGAAAGMRWMQEMAKHIAVRGSHVKWITPCGMLVNQHTPKFESKRLKLHIGGNIVKRARARIATEEVNPRSAVFAIAPNFIHSLDASLLFRVVNACKAKGVDSFAMVHDSYGTHAADADALFVTIREEAEKLFKPDLLKDLEAQLKAQLPINLYTPPLPEYGDLNPECLRKALYFFA